MTYKKITASDVVEDDGHTVAEEGFLQKWTDGSGVEIVRLSTTGLMSVPPARSQFATPYVPVASRTCFGINSGKNSNGTQLGNTYRTAHTALCTFGNAVLIFTNSFNNTGTETDGRNDIQVQAAIETPLTTLFPVTFNGQSSVVIRPGGWAMSDPVGVVLAKGTSFWTRTYMTGSGTSFADGVSNSTTTYMSATAAFTQADVGRSIVGTNIPAGTVISAVASTSSITLSATATASASGLTFILGRANVGTVEGPSTLIWPINQSNSFGGGVGEAANANVNRVLGGTITTGAGADLGGPTSILGIPRTSGSPVIGIIGDSIIAGTTDTTPSSPQPVPGYMLRALNNNYSFVQLAMGSDSASLWNTAANRKRRLPFIGYCTHLVVALGTNSQATAQADLTTLYATLAQYGLPIWAVTIPPRTTSTDSWAATANQTVTANEAARVATNAFIRGGPANVTGYFEVADAVETARDSGKWQSVGSGLAAAITDDGVHPNSAGHTQIAAATAFNAAALAAAFGAISV